MGFQIELDMDDERIKNFIQDIVDQSDKFRPAKVWTDCDHGFDVEFGTNGATGFVYDPRSSYKSRGTKSPVLMDIEEWVEQKLGHKGKHKENVARKVYHNLMRDGMPPQPFFRPAVHNIINMIESDPSWFNKEGNDLLEATRLMKEEMVRLLEENGTVYKGTLRDSLKYDYADDDDEVVSEAMARLPTGVLESDWADLNGNEERAREARRKRRG